MNLRVQDAEVDFRLRPTKLDQIIEVNEEL